MQVLARLENPEVQNRRFTRRRKLRLGATLARSGEAAIIQNLSSTGLLIETAADLSAADELEVEIPEVGTILATVIWISGTYYGCQFEKPIPDSAVSAALLRSPFVHQPPAPAPAPAKPAVRYEESAGEDEPFEDDRYPFGVRLRVILGLSLASWALILWALGLL